MLAVHIDNGQVQVRETAIPDRPPGFALLRLITAGICNTDLELQRGYYGFQGIPGHEFCARVIESDNPNLVGRRVVGEINLACGRCDFCINQIPRHCRNRSVLGIVKHPGAFAEYLTLPEANLHILPDDLPDAEAVFTEPLAAACKIPDQVDFQTGQEVAVLGDGKLGLLIIQVLLAHGLRPVLYGHHASKLALAEAVGARIGRLWQDSRAAYRCVVECSGSQEGLAAAIEMTEPRGVVVLKSTIHERLSLDLAPVIVNELVLLGSRCGRFEPALQLLADGRINVKPMIAAEFSLSEAPAAFERAATRGTLKVLLHNR